MARLGLLWAALGYTLLLEAMLAAAVYFWPEFAMNLAAFRSMTAAVPIARDMLAEIEDKGFLAYVIGQHLFKGANALGVAAAVLFAAPAVAGEAQRGTLELLLARPYSRKRILAERWLAGALATTLPVLLTTLTLPWLALRVDEELALAPLVACALHQALFLLALYAVTFFVSCVGSNPTRISLVVLFVILAEFALYMVQTATHWSIFRLSDMEVLLELADQGNWNLSFVGWLAGTVVVALAAALFAFERRTP